ncbi:HAD family hydrolase [Marinobacter mobilis]|uniref:HAD family hydrolase n=1 Tax=Marinobacter mobilis TaxID=488533 RepID=UPI0035C6B615
MLAVFDLDETLIHGDSSQLFTHFLRAEGIDTMPDANARDSAFMAAYHAGKMDLEDYMAFSLEPLRGWHRSEVAELVERFVALEILPRALAVGRERVDWHRRQGHDVLIISATGEHLVAPIGHALSIDDSIGVQIEWQEDTLTGAIGPRRPFRDGKVDALKQWLADRTATPERVWFYSDSHNDLPLLQHVDHPVAMNPDPILRAHAQAESWPIYVDEKALV